MSNTAPLPLALVLTSFDPGGTEKQMIELIHRLPRERWTVHIACFHERGAWFERAAAAAQSVTRFPVTSFKRAETLRQMGAFARWCRERQIAVVHTSELYSNIFALPAAARAGVPARIANRRELNPDKSPLQIVMQRAAYACATRVVANSRAAAARLALERVPARKVSVVPNGIDLGSFSVHAPRLAGRTVMMVANLRPEKGHDVLLDAAALLRPRMPDIRFKVVGAGTEYGRIQERARALGLADSVELLGHRDDVAALLQQADAFVLPSRSEAFPNALLEAMATGLPVVASGVGGILELVEPDVNGLLVRPGDPSELAAALERVLGEPGLAARLGGAARRTVERGFSFERMASSFEQIYLGELARRGHAAARALQLAAS